MAKTQRACKLLRPIVCHQITSCDEYDGISQLRNERFAQASATLYKAQSSYNADGEFVTSYINNSDVVERLQRIANNLVHVKERHDTIKVLLLNEPESFA